MTDTFQTIYVMICVVVIIIIIIIIIIITVTVFVVMKLLYQWRVVLYLQKDK
jgi:hypothetical protein